MCIVSLSIIIFSAPEELGCFIDDGWDRDLDGYSVPSILITSENCVNICRENRYRYAGVQVLHVLLLLFPTYIEEINS